MTARFCPHCGADLSGEFKFCPNCGRKLPDVDTTTQREEQDKPKDAVEFRVCPTCGFRNSADARACESCGTFLGGEGKGISDERKYPTSAARVQDQEKEGPRKQIPARKEKKKESRQPVQQKASSGKRFHLETYQVAAIVAALFLGGILVYGLMSSKQTSSSDSGSGTPAQQQSASAGQPSPDILHEIDRLREVVNKEPDDLGSILRLSNMLQDNGFYDQAAIYYKRYLDKVPKNVDARVDYGVTLFEAGHTQEAIAQLKEALKIDPKHQIGLFNLGIVYLNAGEFDKANTAFKECVKVNPNSEIGKKAQQTLEQHANITSQEVN